MRRPQFTFRGAGGVYPAADWTFIARKFTQQERDDLVGYHPINGTVSSRPYRPTCGES